MRASSPLFVWSNLGCSLLSPSMSRISTCPTRFYTQKYSQLHSPPSSPVHPPPFSFRVQACLPSLAPSPKSHPFAVYLVTDTAASRGRSVVDVVDSALQGGATIVQYRDKHLDEQRFLKEAMRLKQITQRYKVPLIINDRVDVAVAIDAEGVHVGQEDESVVSTREKIGPNKIMGVSCGTLDEAKRAILQGADYIGVGACFATKNKADAGEPIGMQVLAQIADYARSQNVPVVAIGGINADNAALCIQAGADGVAVIGAIMSAEDPQEAAAQLSHIISDSLQK